LAHEAVIVAGSPWIAVLVVAGHLAGSIVPPASDQFQVIVAVVNQPAAWPGPVPVTTGLAAGG